MVMNNIYSGIGVDRRPFRFIASSWDAAEYKAKQLGLRQMARLIGEVAFYEEETGGDNVLSFNASQRS